MNQGLLEQLTGAREPISRTEDAADDGETQAPWTQGRAASPCAPPTDACLRRSLEMSRRKSDGRGASDPEPQR